MSQVLTGMWMADAGGIAIGAGVLYSGHESESHTIRIGGGTAVQDGSRPRDANAIVGRRESAVDPVAAGHGRRRRAVSGGPQF